jgi:hypothetical protein
MHAEHWVGEAPLAPGEAQVRAPVMTLFVKEPF